MAMDVLSLQDANARKGANNKQEAIDESEGTTMRRDRHDIGDSEHGNPFQAFTIAPANKRRGRKKNSEDEDKSRKKKSRSRSKGNLGKLKKKEYEDAENDTPSNIEGDVAGGIGGNFTSRSTTRSASDTTSNSDKENKTNNACGVDALCGPTVHTKNTRGSNTLSAPTVHTKNTRGSKTLSEPMVHTENTSGSRTLSEPIVHTENTRESKTLSEPAVPTKNTRGSKFEGLLSKWKKVEKGEGPRTSPAVDRSSRKLPQDCEPRFENILKKWRIRSEEIEKEREQQRREEELEEEEVSITSSRFDIASDAQFDCPLDTLSLKSAPTYRSKESKETKKDKKKKKKKKKKESKSKKSKKKTPDNDEAPTQIDEIRTHIDKFRTQTDEIPTHIEAEEMQDDDTLRTFRTVDSGITYGTSDEWKARKRAMRKERKERKKRKPKKKSKDPYAPVKPPSDVSFYIDEVNIDEINIDDTARTDRTADTEITFMSTKKESKTKTPKSKKSKKKPTLDVSFHIDEVKSKLAATPSAATTRTERTCDTALSYISEEDSAAAASQSKKKSKSKKNDSKSPKKKSKGKKSSKKTLDADDTSLNFGDVTMDTTGNPLDGTATTFVSMEESQRMDASEHAGGMYLPWLSSQQSPPTPSGRPAPKRLDPVSPLELPVLTQQDIRIAIDPPPF